MLQRIKLTKETKELLSIIKHVPNIKTNQLEFLQKIENQNDYDFIDKEILNDLREEYIQDIILRYIANELTEDENNIIEKLHNGAGYAEYTYDSGKVSKP